MDEVKAELAIPLVHGDKILMSMMTISLISGEEGKHSNVVGFFHDGSKNEVAKKLGLYRDQVTLELGTVNPTTTIKLDCIV